MKKLRLSRGKYALVNNKDFDKLNKWKWSAHKGNSGFYAVRCVMKKGVQTYIYLHRFLMGAKKGEFVDHRFGNTLDDRRGRLRKCTTKQNCFNRKINKSNLASKFKGVGIGKGMVTRPFRARIVKNRKQYELGYFRTEKEAAIAYNKAAKKLFGKFARLNKL